MLEQFINKLHIWKCTADVDACREYFVDLTTPDEEALRWYKTLDNVEDPDDLLIANVVQANTFLRPDGSVELREYEPTDVGVVTSWFERNIDGVNSRV